MKKPAVGAAGQEIALDKNLPHFSSDFHARPQDLNAPVAGAYYVRGFPEQVAEAALEFMLARDRYIGAWLAWHATPLGADCDPRSEAVCIEAILEVAAREQIS